MKAEELEVAIATPNARGWFICQLRQSHPEGGKPLQWIVVLSDGKYLSSWGEAESIAEALRVAEADIDVVLAREAAYVVRGDELRAEKPKPVPQGKYTIATADLFAALGLKGPKS